jgi:hypothetical protein
MDMDEARLVQEDARAMAPSCLVFAVTLSICRHLHTDGATHGDKKLMDDGTSTGHGSMIFQ